MTARIRRTRRTAAPGLFVPPECQAAIRRGALVSISHSGGKDSQAMTILVSRLVPPGQLLVVHAPLGHIEWPGTMEHIERTIPPGVPLILAHTASGKSLLQRIEERGRFPDARRRFCTSDMKRGPIERELRRYLKASSPVRRAHRQRHGHAGRREPGPREARALAQKRPQQPRGPGVVRLAAHSRPLDRGGVRCHRRRRGRRRTGRTLPACRGSRARSAFSPRGPISPVPPSCAPASIANTRRWNGASATRSRPRAFPCPS